MMLKQSGWGISMWKRILLAFGLTACLGVMLAHLLGFRWTLLFAERVTDVEIAPDAVDRGIRIKWCVTNGRDSVDLMIVTSKDFSGVVSIYAPWVWSEGRDAKSPDPVAETRLFSEKLELQAGEQKSFHARGVRLKEKRIRLQVGE